MWNGIAAIRSTNKGDVNSTSGKTSKYKAPQESPCTTHYKLAYTSLEFHRNFKIHIAYASTHTLYGLFKLCEKWQIPCHWVLTQTHAHTHTHTTKRRFVFVCVESSRVLSIYVVFDCGEQEGKQEQLLLFIILGHSFCIRCSVFILHSCYI